MVSITSQGQISLPVALRRKIGLKTGGKALVSIKDGVILVEPVRDLLTLKGSISSKKKPLSKQKLHNLFMENSALENNECGSVLDSRSPNL